MNESFHKFGSPDEELFGIATEPENSDRKAGILLCGPGLHYHGFYFGTAITIARFLAEHGYYTFRYDPFGVGDSSGELAPGTYNTYFNQVEKGLFVPYHLKSAEYFKTKYNLDRLYSVGLCGGGITGLIAAARSDLFDGVVSISAPVWIHDPNKPLDALIINKHTAKNEMQRYLYSLFKWESLYKFLTFKADYRKIFKVVKSYAIKEKDSQPIDIEHSDEGLNRYFADSFWADIDKKLPVLIVLAEYDLVTDEYNKRFVNMFRDRLNKAGELYQEIVLKKANHKYSDSQSQIDLRNSILEWIDKKDRSYGTL